jgi:ubiquinone/menaquinone biosynthesis C-methylase UbiE
VPAAGLQALTRFYDPLLALTMREGAWRPPLVEQVLAGAPASVLDLGCGTGTLTVELARRAAAVRVVGVDGDREVLTRARAKAGPRTDIEFVEAMAQSLPFQDATFDRVVSSLVFHHLVPSLKHAALTEALRVLAPGGRLHLADFGRPHDPLMRIAFRAGVQALDGMENTRDHADGRLPEIVQAGGFRNVRVTARVRTALGTVELIAADA